MRKVLLGLIALRVIAAAVLILSPAFDSPEDLDGWDVARFQAISDASGQAYVDHEVEYPPGSVALIRAATAFDTGANRRVTSHRVLLVGSLFVDLATALILYRWWRPSTAAAYLVLGTPLIFFGLVRFDLWAILLAVIAAAALRNAKGTKRLDALAASAIVAGALVKIWPALLVVGALAIGRRRAAGWAVLGGVFCGALWLGISGTDALNQVLSLRNAVGWQVESVGGSITALFGDSPVSLQADAFRIGTMQLAIVRLSRIVALVAAAILGWFGWRSDHHQRLALVVLGSTAALMVTAPLLSPQFLLWLTPWAAILYCPGESRFDSSDNAARALWATGAAVTLTAVILTLAGPPNLHHTVPALALLGRDVLLAVVVVLSGLALRAAPLRRTPER